MNFAWFRFLVQIAPWLTLVLLIAMFAFLQGSLSPAPAVSFELPAPGAADSAVPGLVALVLPGDASGAVKGDTLIIFDDDRYELADSTGMDRFAERLASRAAEMKCTTLTLLCDRSVPAGDVMRVMAIARRSKLAHVQLAEKRDI